MLMAHLPSVLYAGGLLLISSLPGDIPSSNAESSPTVLVPSPASNAARLLVEPKIGGSFARMTNNPQNNFQNNLALQQLSQQRALQDSRLEQCQERQEDFEQCFFYGTGGIDRMDGLGLVGGSSPLVGARYPPNADGIGSSTSTPLGESSSSRYTDENSSTGSSSRKTKTKTTVPTW